MDWIKYTMAFTGLLCVSQCLSADEKSVSNLLENAVRGGAFVAATAEDLRLAEDLFVRLFQNDLSGVILPEKALPGLEIRRARFGKEAFIVVMEKADAKRGRGFYLFRETAESGAVLMMPHGFYDLYTRDIGLKLFMEGGFKAAAWNTVHRFGGTRKQLGGNPPLPWDLADRTDSYFIAFTRALARTMPQGRLIQVHGFTPEKRTTGKGAVADMILSSGSRTPGPYVSVLCDCLTTALPANIRTYSKDVSEMGGTKNISGQVLRQMGHEGFVHMEISLDLRARLKEDDGLRRRFISCVTGGHSETGLPSPSPMPEKEKSQS